MRTADIRRRYLDYFEAHDHTIVPSASLISPDPSILFTIAGMVPFIPYIIGTEPAPYPRAASVQKCIRTNDIENVGRTTRHGTFFQMMGNFSFGDYFKDGAVDLAWEFLTGPEDEGKLAFDGSRMWVTIWEEDEVAAAALVRVGVDPDQIVRLPREENFWDTGQPGPAGPCAEFHYDRGPEFGPDAVGGDVDPGGDRYLEIWNLVFDQFLRGEGTGKSYPLIKELDAKAIDTGAGLERIAFLKQGVANMYEIDEVRPVITRAEELSGKAYGSGDVENDVRMRVVADHVRSALMLVADGVRPGNEGRGYVLRRLVRRAVRAMRLLGVTTPSLPELLPVSVAVMKESYPELEADFQRIAGIVYGEEDAFRRTLESGTTILDSAVRRVRDGGGTVLGGEDAFKLHDTYGFPIDLTVEMAAEQGVSIDTEAFTSLMQEQRQRARADALTKKTGHVDTSVYTALASDLAQPVQFLGYTDATAQVRVVGLLADGASVPHAVAPADVEVILDRTPFYAEAGGQLADQGQIVLDGGGVVEVDDVQAPIKGLSVHRGRLVEGEITLDAGGVATIDTQRRRAIARAHTATHLVHKALRETLGENATQAGSENAPHRLRFDFRSGGQPPAGSLAEISERVNTRAAEDLDVTDRTMGIDDARALGAMALFGEKYGDKVRVVSIGGDWSRELCAGTHVLSTGHLGPITLLGEASIGSGVRRVDALVGDAATRFHAKEQVLVSQLSTMVGARSEELPERISGLLARLKEAEREVATLRQAQLLAGSAALLAGAQDVDGVRVLTHELGEVSSADDVRTLALDLRDRLGSSAVVVVGGVTKGRAAVVVATAPDARDRGVRAGELVRGLAAALGGKGGGRDDVAQGGGTDAASLPTALAGVEPAVREIVGRA
ncbi:alanine--tRNA ligase [Serinibacter arcticus]|uniref:Alanine--tRNA ligase n=1 Tax=Serinibacter arcticus TaxID=1655435 RepID=A0A4Z1DYY5_9MICO|nr:alanine--tRNA ligase [Serinibacter arcticus]TGO04736.1 Alanyl-tRNA synthetase [Serinibacter arcticus]